MMVKGAVCTSTFLLCVSGSVDISKSMWLIVFETIVYVERSTAEVKYALQLNHLGDCVYEPSIHP